MFGSSRIGIANKLTVSPVDIPFSEDSDLGMTISTFTRGEKNYELSNHLGNVLVTITDKKIRYSASIDDYYGADVVSAVDYFPFGMTMPGRSYSSDGYRYGFNGKEKDKDMNSLTAYDYGFRIYNPAIGRFLSVDPLTAEYPELTPYQYASNRPIDGVDIDGLEWNKVGYAMKTNVPLKGVKLAPYNGPTVSIGKPTLHRFAQTYNPQNPIQESFIERLNNTPWKFKDRLITDMVIAGGPEKYMIEKTMFSGGPVEFVENLLNGAINDAFITFKAMGSGIGGYSKNDITDLNGEQVSYDKRMGAGLNTFAALITGAIGIEARSIRAAAAESNITEKSAGAALDGSFSLTELGWECYPSGAPRPSGPFKIILGEEYSNALKLKNSANAALHREFPSLKGYDFHEWQPVKFGGSPTDIFNKGPLKPSYHQQFTKFWRNLQNTISPFVIP